MYNVLLLLSFRPQPQAVPTSSARSNQNVAQGEGGAPHSKPPVVHPRSSQYRWMKNEWRANVFLGRSRVQVRGVGGGFRSRFLSG